MHHRLVRLAALAAVLAWTAPGRAAAQERAPELPVGISPTLWKVSVPPGRAPTPDKVKLGEKLFNDPRLSSNDKVSCATCHVPELGFVDGKALSDGVVPNEKTKRNSPTVLNALFNSSQFWDGRSATLEDQAKLPILNPIEMGMKSGDEVMAKVRAVPEYAAEFKRIYGREATFDDLADAIAAFERTQASGSAPFDDFIQGKTQAMNPAARRGWALFNGKARCNECHAANAVSPLFSDQKFHNIGIAAHKQDFVTLAREGLEVIRTGDEKQIDELAIQSAKYTELGRFLVTKRENDVGSFRTPTLRNVGITGPYMHDGSLATLWDVMDHYNKGGVPNPFLDGGMQRLGLTEREIDDLVELMFALTDKRYAKRNEQERSRQAKRKGNRPERDTAVAMGKKGNLGDLAPDPDLKNPADIGTFGRYPEVTK